LGSSVKHKFLVLRKYIVLQNCFRDIENEPMQCVIGFALCKAGT
jgi:hypothetical protein